MAEETFPLLPKASISLALMANAPRETRARTAAVRAMGLVAFDGSRRAIAPPPQAAVIVEAPDPDKIADRLGDATINRLSDNFLSVQGDVDVVAGIAGLQDVRRVQTKKLSQLHLDNVLPDIGLAAPPGPRPVAEDGTGVLVGIVDSGFDLSHPMFRDRNGKLRVEAVLDQTLKSPREFSTAQLEKAWSGNSRPGADDGGHGTHVASIAAGSRSRGLEGVAPKARFLLVKTNFIDTDVAVAWIFSKAGNRPCVVNLSLGHHYGAHDGTDAEELVHAQLTGPGRIIVVSAGNEREDDLHIGGRFHNGQSEDVVFDIQRQPDGQASVVLTLWHDRADRFAVSLVAPNGTVIDEPAMDKGKQATLGGVNIDISQQRVKPGKVIQHQIGVNIRTSALNTSLRGWRVRLTCRKATVGRVDGWFSNSGFAAFRPHPLTENARTVGLAATGAGCLAVASHISKTAWDSDAGSSEQGGLVIGRSSPFSSLGPNRIGAQKPDISAPGQQVTAALAAGSEMADDPEAADTGRRLLTIAGTSMAAPVVTGAVALLLQQKPKRTLKDIRDILSRTARRDAHTGPAAWDPFYGVGKLDIAEALQNG
jgi:subtilisin family serine protease